MQYIRVTRTLTLLAASLLLLALTPVLAQDMMYSEAPALAALVAAGELPPVEERLPANPLVVEPIDSVGVYGGIWNRAWTGINDFHVFGRITYDPVLRWPRDPTDTVQPGLAESWEWNEDGTQMTLNFREGLRWSDGEPWTVDDVIFWWEAIETETNITAAIHGEWQVGGEPMTLEKIDDSTIRLNFAAPNGLAETVGLAFHGHQWPLGFERFGFFAPEHYLAQFHPAYSETGSWEQFEEKAFDYNVDRPVMTSWTISEYEPGTTLMIAHRNPYYWKVDIEGQQLPYIDSVYFHLVEGNPGVNIMGISGDLDMQARRLSLAQFPVYQENAEANDFHMLLWGSAQASSAAFFFNQSYPEDNYRELFQDLRFRRAMSVAVDRETVNQVAYLGQGIARTETVVRGSPYFQADIETVDGEYDPELAIALLDEIGLLRGSDGFYTFADGSDLQLVVETTGSSGNRFDAFQLAAEWWNEIGVRTEIESMTRDVYWPRAGANEVMVATWGLDRGLVPMVDPIYQFPFDERSWMAPAFGIWYKSGGAAGLEPTDEFKAAMALYDQYKAETDAARQLELGKELVRMSTTNLWAIGLVGMVPNPVVVRNNFQNVAPNHTADWIIMTPGTLDPAHFYFSDGG